MTIPPGGSVRIGVRTKLIALLVGTALTALIMVCAAFAYYDRASFREARESTLTVLAGSVAQSAFGPTAFADPDSASVILKVLEQEPMALAGAIYLADNKRLVLWTRSGSNLTLAEDFTQLSGGSKELIRITREISTPEQKVGNLHVVFDTKDIEARTKRFVQIAAAVLGIAVLFALLLAGLTQGIFTRPITLLSEAAARVQKERDFDVRAQKVSNDELGSLTDAFNSMLAMIQSRDRELESHRTHLEDLVSERTRDLAARNDAMRLVMDNVNQGFITLDRDAIIGSERSATFDKWFGTPEGRVAFGTHVGAQADGFAERFAMYFSEAREGFFPLEVTVGQLPSHVETDAGRHFELAYTPINHTEDHFEKLLVVLSDVTERVERERSEAEQAQTMAIFEHISRDRSGFVEFFEEAEQLVKKVTEDSTLPVHVALRELHTLKGNFGLFGLKPLASLIHHIESDCIDSGELPTADHRASLRAGWRTFADRARMFLGVQGRTMNIEFEEMEELETAVKGGASTTQLVSLLKRFWMDPVKPKLERLATRAEKLAERLGRAPISVVVESKGIRTDADLAWLWQVLPHVIANCVDHGLKPASEQPGGTRGMLRIAAAEVDGQLSLQIGDNGGGIDWEAVRTRAKESGLAHATEADLIAALFADRFSTRREATEISGRGVGLSAVKAACDSHGCSINVTSTRGHGTTFHFVVPLQPAASRARRSLRVPSRTPSVPPPARNSVS